MTDSTSHEAPAWARTSLLDGLPTALTEVIAQHIDQRAYRAGERVLAAGAPCEALYIVLEGAFVTDDTPARTLTASDSIGEVELLTGAPLESGLVAQTDGALYVLTRADFIAIGQHHPALTLSLVEGVLPRLSRRQVADILGVLRGMGLPIPNHILYSAQLSMVLREVFGELAPAIVNDLQNRLEWQVLETGETLFRQGESGTDMCIVVNGRLRVVYRDALGTLQTVGDLVTGETVGEFALLTDELRSATVYAVRETHVVRVTRAVFYELIERAPNTMLHITRSMVRRQQRVQSGTNNPRAACLNIAVIPLHQHPPASFVQALTSGLAKHGRTLLLDSERFDGEFGVDGAHDTDTGTPMSAVVAGWLSNLETSFDSLLYIGQAGWTPWTRRCLRQADRVYLLADATQSPELTRIERAIREQYPRLPVELVLLHPSTTDQPNGTADWLDRRDVRAHHHVRLGTPQHVHRLTRRMVGKSVGLVLSGGGARGLAHIGVIKALEEAGLELDLICGTSIGGLVGAAYILNPSIDELLKATGKFASSRAIFDYTLPFVSLMASRKISTIYREVFGETMIEDLWTPFFAVSSSMSSAVPIVHKRGSLRRAIRASTAIPGVFTPLLHDNEVLIDGGLLDNFPTAPAREFLGGCRLIGVLASPLNDNIPFYTVTDEYISGWRVLLNRLNPFGKRMDLPTIPTLVVRAIELFNVLRIKTALQGYSDDLILQLETSGISGLDFTAYHRIVELGYKQAKPLIEGWAQGAAR
jgi:predicted acylesterase/phospholipase RssA/CRP-like cAMP-binding protein